MQTPARPQTLPAGSVVLMMRTAQSIKVPRTEFVQYALDALARGSAAKLSNKQTNQLKHSVVEVDLEDIDIINTPFSLELRDGVYKVMQLNVQLERVIVSITEI